MAISVLFNGITYSIPETGEESWENLTSYFTAIPQGALQKTGGSFTLTADVNFGANYGLLSKYFSTRSTNPSSAGLVRLALSDTIGWRNNANSANLLLAVNGSDQLTFNGTAIYPAGITALTGDVTATGPGSVAATVAFVGGYSAANVAAGATLANAATNLNTLSAIVKRDGSGNFVAGTITAALTGTASGNTTYTANQYGVVVSGSANAMGVIAPDSSTTKVLVSGGASANPSWQDIATSALALGAFGSTPSSSGASLSAGTLTLQPADGTHPGGVSILAQTFAGIKTFSSAPVFSSVTASQVLAVDSGKALTSLVYASANTVSALVQRDGSGNFSAGTITASLTGTASGNTTISANQYGVVLSGSANVLQVLAPDASATKVLKSGGSSANPSWIAYDSVATASILMSRDSNANVNANNVSTNYATTATAASDTTLTVASAYKQYFTGSTTQNCILPDATTLPQTGFGFYLVNLSTGAVTIKDAGSNSLLALAGSSFAFITAKSIGSANGSWDIQYGTNAAGGGTVTSVAMTVPTALFATSPVSGSPVTTSGTLAPTLATQSANTVFAGPSSGSAATPTFRALVFNDIPGAVYPCDGRITLTTGVPVTITDVTAATTVYFTPYKGSRIALYDGSSTWTVLSFTEISLAVPATTSTMYDLFVYNSSGTATLEALAWTNDTTRATALTTQNGILVKTGATTRRYLGSFRTTTSSGQTEDSAAKRYVWNYYNRCLRCMKVVDTTDSWTYTTNAYRQANGNAANQLDMVIGVQEDAVQCEVMGVAYNSSISVEFSSGIGIDSTTTNSATLIGSTNVQAVANTTTLFGAKYTGYPGIGRHYLAWLERSQATGTTTWIGDLGTSNYQTGIIGSIFG